jgi:hypothetical protein
MPGEAAAGALDTDEGRAVAAELVAMLESELVRFCHRVTHDHGIALDRARASMVLLGTLVAAGAPWTARGDSSPGRIFEAFAELAARNDAGWPPANAIRRELDDFLEQTGDVEIVDAPARTPSDLLRRAGADPDLWWWAMGHDTRQRCWLECASNVPRIVQVALAFGVSSELVARAFASAFALAATKSKTRRQSQRNDLVALLMKLAASGIAALAAERELVNKATKLAFEMAATRLGSSRMQAPDGIGEISVLSFQLVELFQAAARPADLERYAELGSRAERTFNARGLRLAALLRRDLEPAVAAAVAAPLA